MSRCACGGSFRDTIRLARAARHQMDKLAKIPDYNRRYENLLYIGAEQFTVTAGGYDKEYKLCHLKFRKKDGSIMLSFPYMPRTDGVLSIAKFPPDYVGGPTTLSYASDARAT